MYLFIAQTSNGEIRGQFLFDTARKVAKYGVISGPYFPVFGLNTEIYSSNVRIQSKYRKIRTRKNSVYGHFSRSSYTGI